MWTSISHGNTKALRITHGNVRTLLPRSESHYKGEEVSAHRLHDAGWELLKCLSEVSHSAEVVRRLHNDTAEVVMDALEVEVVDV